MKNKLIASLQSIIDFDKTLDYDSEGDNAVDMLHDKIRSEFGEFGMRLEEDAFFAENLGVGNSAEEMAGNIIEGLE